MVRTLANAFAANRIPQAWMLTGVRGVGKTTTARILARGLNYARAGHPDTGPTVVDAGTRPALPAIMESRHMDVLEMDAASHTGIDDVRGDHRRHPLCAGLGPLQGLHRRRGPHALREGVQRLPEDAGGAAAARQVRVRHHRDPQGPGDDPVALPAVRPAPRRGRRPCSRTSPRSAPPKASRPRTRRWRAIVRAAEGSVRDALSLLDQAIAHGAGPVTAQSVRDMLGLADRGRILDLFEAVMRGDVPGRLRGTARRSTIPAPTRRWCCPTSPPSPTSSPA